jgi:hypothetical protein
VKWFKKRSPEPTVAEINARIRGFILDSQVTDAHDISVILGCGPISEEIAEKEEEESDKRLDKISHLMPMIYAHSQALSQGSIEYQRTNVPESLQSLPDELWWDSRKLLEQVSSAAIVGSIAQLVDMGLLEIPKRYR